MARLVMSCPPPTTSVGDEHHIEASDSTDIHYQLDRMVLRRA